MISSTDCVMLGGPFHGVKRDHGHLYETITFPLYEFSEIPGFMGYVYSRTKRVTDGLVEYELSNVVELSDRR